MADDRTYIRVHDGLDEHPKVEPLSDGAFRLLLTCWFYCSRNRTDGQIARAVWRKRGTPKTRDELIEAGLVEEHEDHVEMHDYTEHQRTAEEIRLLREVRGDNGTFGNHVRWHVVKRKPKKDCEFCEADAEGVANGSQERSQRRSQTDRKPVASTEAEAEAEAEVTSKSSEGGSHVSSDSPNDAPPLFPDHCKRHADDPTPGNCGNCKDQREANRARPALALVTPAKRCIVHDETFTNVCRGCRADEIAAEETA